MSLISGLYVAFQETAWLDTLFFGLKAAVLAIVLEAVVRIGRRALKTNLTVVIATVAFLGDLRVWRAIPGHRYRRWRTWLSPDAAGAACPGAADHDSAAGDDAADARLNLVEPTLRRAVIVTLSSLALWAAPAALIGLILGFDTIFSEIALFFSWLAVVTFGGAYAVLAYVADTAVTSYGWLAPGEMLDGMAMAETTHGPLILVLSFVA